MKWPLRIEQYMCFGDACVGGFGAGPLSSRPRIVPDASPAVAANPELSRPARPFGVLAPQGRMHTPKIKFISIKETALVCTGLGASASMLPPPVAKASRAPRVFHISYPSIRKFFRSIRSAVLTEDLSHFQS